MSVLVLEMFSRKTGTTAISLGPEGGEGVRGGVWGGVGCTKRKIVG